MRMKKLLCLVSMLFLLVNPGVAQDLSEKGFELMKVESLEGVKFGMSDKALVKAIGKPVEKGEDVEWEAIGEHVQEWRYPALGLVFQMSSIKKGGAKKVLAITMSAPSKRATKRGIRVGSSEAEVKKAYADLMDKESSEAGAVFVAGSVYGGLLFKFADGKVSEIFVGASAE